MNYDSLVFPDMIAKSNAEFPATYKWPGVISVAAIQHRSTVYSSGLTIESGLHGGVSPKRWRLLVGTTVNTCHR